MAGISHGMNVEAVEELGQRLQINYTIAVRDLVIDIDRLVGNTSTSWVGADAERFRSWWSAKRTRLQAMADDLHGFGQSALNNLVEQRQASAAGLRGGGSDSSTGPPPVALFERSSEVTTKSGAVVAGSDGSEIEMRKLSDGTFAVDIALSDGIRVDFGDAKSLWDAAHGKFFGDGGVAWDLDLSAERSMTVSYVFTDEQSARIFYDGLQERQHEFINMTVGGGLSRLDVADVINNVRGDLEGEVTWERAHSGVHLVASGEIGVGIGPTGDQVGSSLSVGDLQGYTSSTIASDGSVGELAVMRGTGNVTGGIEKGPFQFEAGGTVGYERQVHVVRDAAGTPLSLEVSETFATSVGAAAGDLFLGTGAGFESVTGGHLVSIRSFDLTDDSVSAVFAGVGQDAGSLADFAEANSNLGGHTVATYDDAGANANWSLLWSGKGEDNWTQSTLTQHAFRPPGTASYEMIK